MYCMYLYLSHLSALVIMKAHERPIQSNTSELPLCVPKKTLAFIGTSALGHTIKDGTR